MMRKRRRLSLTNYKKRVKMLKSGMVRLVVRRSNRRVIAQLVKYEQDGDKILSSASSDNLSKFNWEPRCNIPSAYLTGLLLARKSKDIKTGNVILDIGLSKPIKGSVIFAAAKGAQDGGLKLLGTYEVEESRINGKHIAEYAKSLSGEAMKKQFAYSKSDPKALPEAFEKAKAQIVGG
ncbi:MAG: 50S ribosomal protein L18 [Candidatus Micrarchaeia archaeon]